MDSNAVVGIIGSGAMGSGIAQVAAEAGHTVLIYDNNEAAQRRAGASMSELFASLVAKGKRTAAEAEAVSRRIRYVGSLLELDRCGLVIEAIVEDLQVKRSVIEELSHAVAADCILATNTSSLSVTALAASAKTPAQVLGLHFFNPAPLMRLVEVVPAVQTEPAHVETCVALMEAWGKTAVVASDTPGFIVNRVARPYYSEALRIYDEGLATPAEIDAAMEATGFRMGPFYLMDFIGHDVNFRVTESMYRSFWEEPRYRPSFSQKALLDAGYLGRKVGRGFYRFDESRQLLRDASELSHVRRSEISDRILAVLINEAADALHFGVADRAAIDRAMLLGVNYPKGLLAWADEIGRDTVVARLDKLYEYYHEQRYRVSPGLRA